MATIERPWPCTMQETYEASWADDALRVANEARGTVGLPPCERLEKGARGSQGSCPIAMTVKADAGKVRWRVAVNSKWVTFVWPRSLAVRRADPDAPAHKTRAVMMSTPAALFVKAFDDGELFDEYAL